MPVEHEDDWYDLDLGDMTTVQWIDSHGNTIRTEERPYEWRQISDITPFDDPLYTYDTNGTGLIGITNDIVDRYAGPEGREYIWPGIITIDKADVHIHGEWICDDEEQTDIKEECGGALDEFLKEFNPQQTITERSDEQE